MVLVGHSEEGVCTIEWLGCAISLRCARPNKRLRPDHSLRSRRVNRALVGK
jgi:hypothetical protein